MMPPKPPLPHLPSLTREQLIDCAHRLDSAIILMLGIIERLEKTIEGKDEIIRLLRIEAGRQ